MGDLGERGCSDFEIAGQIMWAGLEEVVTGGKSEFNVTSLADSTLRHFYGT